MKRVMSKKETLIVGQCLIKALPMLIPLEEQVKLEVMDIWEKGKEETGKPVKKKWGVLCRCEREWADGLIIYEITIPLNLLRRIVIPGRFSRRLLLGLTDLARERKTIEVEATKQELLRVLRYSEERLKKGSEIYELIDCALSVWSRIHIEVRPGKGKYWKDFVKWEGGPIDAFGWRVREKGKGARLYVRLSKEIFGDPQYLKIQADRLSENLPRDKTFFLDYVDLLQGFPDNKFGVRRLFTEKLGYTSEKLAKIGPKEIEKRLYRILDIAKEKGRLKKPFYEIYKKGSENALDWVIKIFLSRNKEKELIKEILQWMKESPGWKDEKQYKARVKIHNSIKKWRVEWAREAFEWCLMEGKHPKDFWEELDEGPSFEEQMLEEEV